MQIKKQKTALKKNIFQSLFQYGLFFLLMAVVFFESPTSAQAKTWLVGPEFTLKSPSAAIKLATDGDTIKIFAALYENDYAIINQNNLILEGMNGVAHLKSSGRIPGGKAIWVTNGQNIIIRNIEFSGAKVPDKNGAGIRLQRGSLIIDNCYFHDNEMGLLTSNNPAIRLTIENSEFSRSRQDYLITGKLSHNIYVGAIDSFVMKNSISRGAKYGHLVKSRARNTVIRNNRLFDEGDISASYLIDIPNGGNAHIENNYLYRNKGAQNNALISYGAEGMKYSQNSLTIKYNTAINESGMAFLLRDFSNVSAIILANKTTNITANEIFGVGGYGFWGRVKNKIRDILK